MKQKIRSLLLFFIIIIFVATLSFAVSLMRQGITAFADSSDSYENIGDDFEKDSVIITLTEEETKKYKTYTADDFKEVGCVEVEDLTQFTTNYVEEKAHGNSTIESMLVETENYKKILKLTLNKSDTDNVINAIEALNKRKEVLVAGPNYIYTIASTPNDAYWIMDGMWGLKDKYGIKAQSAWDITTGVSTVTVGVLDTGIQANHPDLVNRISTEGLHRDCTVNPITAVSNTNLKDPNGHGTHVAGIIGAQGNNSIGITGVCWDIRLVSLRVFYEDGTASTTYLARAIDYAASKNIPILNYSGGGYFKDMNVQKALENYKGLFVCAAGNGDEKHIGVDNDTTRFYPSDYSYNQTFSDRVMSVGAINDADYRMGFSNYGKKSVSLYAPGWHILSTYPTSLCTGGTCDKSLHLANGYHYDDGTSMATPFVTGVAALLLSKNSNLTAAELKTAILDNADDIQISVPNSSEPQEVKKLNAYKAVESLEKETYTVTIHGRNTEVKVSVAYGEMMPLPHNSDETPKYTGHEFVGYFSGENGTGTQYYSMELARNDNAVDLGDLYYERLVPIKAWDHFSDGDIYVHWKKMECDYSYTNIKQNEGYFDKKTTVHLIHGETATITAETFDGYDFLYFEIGSRQFTESTIEWTAELVRNGADGLIYPYFRFKAVYKKKECVAEGTLITLANGEQVPVELLTGDETLLVWNLFTGTFDTAPILCIDSDPLGTYQVINLYFSDDTQVKVISEHGFWDFDLNKYVYLDKNASEYIGHWFNKQTVNENGEFSWTSVQLTDVIIQEEYTTAWSPVTYSHLCYYVNGMLSMPGGIEGLFNIFEVDSQTMTYNSEAMAEDIEQYGLFTYEEFAELLPVPNEVFEAVNGQYLKVAIGKGLIDLDTLARYINQYARLFN